MVESNSNYSSLASAEASAASAAAAAASFFFCAGVLTYLTSVPSSQSYTGQQAGKSALGSDPSLTRLHPGVALRSTTGPQSVTSSARRPDSSLTHLEAPQKGARDHPSPGLCTLHWVDAKQLSLKSLNTSAGMSLLKGLISRGTAETRAEAERRRIRVFIARIRDTLCEVKKGQ